MPRLSFSHLVRTSTAVSDPSSVASPSSPSSQSSASSPSSGAAGPDGATGRGPGAGPGGPRGDRRTGLGVPLLAHPLVAPAEWAELARPGAPLDWVAFDVRRGPGTCCDPVYAEALARVRENAVPVLGLLDLAHGTRPFGDLVSDASHHLDWYRVDGFYLDRAPTLRTRTAECRRVVSTLRAMLGQERARGGQWARRSRQFGEQRQFDGQRAGEQRQTGGRRRTGGQAAGLSGTPVTGPSSTPVTGPSGIRAGRAEHHVAAAAREPVSIVLAPGVYPHPGYAETADQLVVFDGPWTRYRWSEAPEWSAAYPPSRFAHLVHGVPVTHLDDALRIARWQGAGTVGMTDRTDRDGADPWSGLSGHWDEVVRKVCH